MGNLITALSRESIELWRVYHLLLVYPSNQEECVAQIQKRANMAYQHVQKNCVERLGFPSNKLMEEEVPVAVLQQQLQQIKKNEAENEITFHRRALQHISNVQYPRCPRKK